MKQRFIKRISRDLGRMTIVLVIFVALWQVIVIVWHINSLFLPSPFEIGMALSVAIKSREFTSDVIISLQRALIGFVIGSVAGIILGILTGRLRILDQTIGQLIRLFRPIPSIALVPLVIVWLGLGEIGKYVLILWGVFFPVWINSHIGAAQIERRIMWAGQSLGVTRWRGLYEIVLPSALPFVIAGMRTGMAVAFVVLVAAEMAGAFGGVGYRIYISHQVFRVDKMMAGIFTLGVLGAVSDIVFAAVVDAIPWRRSALEDWHAP